MASVLKAAQAGTLESGDIMIQISPGEVGKGLGIEPGAHRHDSIWRSHSANAAGSGARARRV